MHTVKNKLKNGGKIQASFTEFDENTGMEMGKVGDLVFQAKLNDYASRYEGIAGGRVTKLDVWDERRGIDYINYDNKWIKKPDPEHEEHFLAVMMLLENAPKRFSDGPTIDEIIPGHIELEDGGTMKYISLAPEGTVFVKINSHRASDKVNRTGIPNISFWNMHVNSAAAQSIHLINESDYNKIKDIVGVSAPLKQLKSPGQIWTPRLPSTDSADERKLYDAYSKLNEKNYANGGDLGDFANSNKIHINTNKSTKNEIGNDISGKSKVSNGTAIQTGAGNIRGSQKTGEMVEREFDKREEIKELKAFKENAYKNGGKTDKQALEGFIARYNLWGRDAKVKFKDDYKTYFTKNIHPDRKHIFVFEEDKSGAPSSLAYRATRMKLISDIVSVEDKPASVIQFMKNGGITEWENLPEIGIPTHICKKDYVIHDLGQVLPSIIICKKGDEVKYDEKEELFTVISGENPNMEFNLILDEDFDEYFSPIKYSNGGKSYSVKKYLLGGDIGSTEWTGELIKQADAFFDLLDVEPTGEDYVRFIQDTLKHQCVSNFATAENYYKNWLLNQESKMKNGGKYKLGGTITPQKKVKANQAIAISEVLAYKLPDGTRPFRNLSPMEAGMLYNLRDKEGTKEVSDATGLKEQIYKKLEDKIYIDVDYNDYTFTLSDSAKDFINRVNNRLETRRSVKAGLDMFPETANIPELKMKNGGKVYKFTGKKGSRAISNTDNSIFGLKKGKEFVVKKQYFDNGEHWIKTTSGEEFPSVFFYEKKQDGGVLKVESDIVNQFGQIPHGSHLRFNRYQEPFTFFYPEEDSNAGEYGRRLQKQYPKLIVSPQRMEDGGDLNIQGGLHLPYEISVYVPSTKDVDKQVTKPEMDKRTSEVTKYLADKFGGYTSMNTTGGYFDHKHKLVNEPVIKITSFSTEKDFKNNKQNLLDQIRDWSKEWGQEAVGLEFEGDLYYVSENKMADGGRTTSYIKAPLLENYFITGPTPSFYQGRIWQNNLNMKTVERILGPDRFEEFKRNYYLDLTKAEAQKFIDFKFKSKAVLN